MERITERMTDCWIKTRSGKDYTNKTQDYDAMLKLADYEDYDEKGLLVRLPLKLGDTYYRLLNGKIYANEFTCLSTIITFMENHDFGRTVFSTYEEAERAQKRQEKEKIKRNPPCSIGTTIYILVDWEDGAYQRIKNDIVKGYFLDDKEELYLIPTYLWHDQPISEIGKTIFFSEDEAKKALLSQYKKTGEKKDQPIVNDGYGMIPECPVCGEMPYSTEQCHWCGQRFLQDEEIKKYAEPKIQKGSCPNCGAPIDIHISSYNGHKHFHCDACKMTVME